MQPWKRLLLSAYVAGSMPYRRWAAQQAAESGAAPITVLFYHRVADDRPNPWTISRDAFDWQIDWLQANVDIISLAEAQRRLRLRDSRRPAVCITFDDGYADNCLHALPLLVKERIPCSYFVSSDFVLGGKPFPHDVARGEPHAPNTLEQLRALASAGVEIGAHTRTHPNLAKIHDRPRLWDEIVTSTNELEQAIRRPLRYFAFPFGQREHLSPAAFAIAREHGFAGVCSAYGGYNLPGDDAFHLQRVHADPEPARFINWLTIDPRKRRVRRFEYEGSVEPVRGFQAAANRAAGEHATKSDVPGDETDHRPNGAVCKEGTT
jgi:peptidoglycan/xylan/chitin deacetylase (PgdA/CDA1 family)